MEPEQVLQLDQSVFENNGNKEVLHTVYKWSFFIWCSLLSLPKHFDFREDFIDEL